MNKEDELGTNIYQPFCTKPPGMIVDCMTPLRFSVSFLLLIMTIQADVLDASDGPPLGANAATA